MIGIRLHGLQQFEAGIQRRLRQISRNTNDALREGTGLIADSGRRRVKLVRQVTIQDNTNAVTPRRKPITTSVRAGVGIVTLAGYWGRARDPVIVKFMARHGYSADLRRKSLWIAPAGIIPGKGRHGRGSNRRDRYKFTRLRGRVKHWAETATSPMRPGAPFPILRGAVRLPAEVRLDLVMGPAADEQAEPVAQLLNRAMLRGLI